MHVPGRGKGRHGGGRVSPIISRAMQKGSIKRTAAEGMDGEIKGKSAEGKAARFIDPK